jgi:hypothetical protein
MEKDNVMDKSLYRTPMAAELYALERRAREERARYIAAGIASAAVALKSVIERALTALSAKVVRHA